MSNNRFTISEQEKSEIKKLYVLNEQDSLPNARRASYRGGGEGNERPGKTNYKWVDSTTTQDLGAGLFLNGIDKINTNSPEFKTALNKIKTVLTSPTETIPVTIKGGASNVGTSKGYDNKALANRRRDNFIVALKNSLGKEFSRLNITSGDAIIGQATVKNSPEANAEQIVQISYPEKNQIIKGDYQDATSTTDVATDKDRGEDKFKPKIIDPTKPQYMIVKIWYKGDKKTFQNKIFDSTGSPVHELIDYDTAKDLRFK
jgi:hypothetical protein